MPQDIIDKNKTIISKNTVLLGGGADLIIFGT